MPRTNVKSAKNGVRLERSDAKGPFGLIGCIPQSPLYDPSVMVLRGNFRSKEFMAGIARLKRLTSDGVDAVAGINAVVGGESPPVFTFAGI